MLFSVLTNNIYNSVILFRGLCGIIKSAIIATGTGGVAEVFGYVRLNKPEIKMGEYEQYRGIYCTLCRRLGRRYGLHARMTLSYDSTFLALLQMALEDAPPDFCPGRCSFNPVKRCLKCRNTAAIDRAADLAVLLTYYKLQDTRRDEGFWKRLGATLLLPLAALDRRRAAKRQPAAETHIAAMMAAQRAVETAHTASVDAAAEPFARLLEWMAADTARDDTERRILERFGYCLGRWVYLMDAADDLPEDLSKNRYNPYIFARNIQKGNEQAVREAREYAAGALNASLAECIAAYNLLNPRRFDGILRNILEQGMPAAMRRVIAGEDRTHEQGPL